MHSITSIFKRPINAFATIEQKLKLEQFIKPHENYKDFLLRNKIISVHETPQEMFERTSTALAMAGSRYYNQQTASNLKNIFHTLLTDYKIVLSTPMYTNAGRHKHKSFSACAVPPVNFKKFDKNHLKALIKKYHSQGMGTGFNFDDADDPVTILKLLNQFAIAEVHQGIIERPVGNMGILSIEHPKALEFAAVKKNSTIREWKFNISLNINDKFMQAFKENKSYLSHYGHRIHPREYLKEIAGYTHITGDPGIVFMDRYAQSNKTPQLGNYVSVAPCSEVPLLNGEVCHFAYINLSQCLNNDAIDYEDLRYTVHQTVLLLDNAIELSIQNMPTKESAYVIEQIRKIGIGVCGFSDLLFELGLPYDSNEALQVAEDLMSFINYESKTASVELAKHRGPFPSFYHPETRRELIIAPFLGQESRTVLSDYWDKLNQSVLKYGIRNSATVILPPTGRSSLVAGVSTSIEPQFKICVTDKFKKNFNKYCKQAGFQGNIEKELQIIKKTGSTKNTSIPTAVKHIFQTCLELSTQAHLQMTAKFQRYIDEAISKTVNLPQDSNDETIVDAFIEAYDMGLKGISVYVDKSRTFQPRQLGKTLHPTKNNPVYYDDPVYGQIELPNNLEALVNTSIIQRLKSIHQHGINYLFDNRFKTTRFEHSLGVMHAIKLLGGNLEQQIIGLFHDAKHTAFSHVVDVITDNQKQNYHEQLGWTSKESEEVNALLKQFCLTKDCLQNLNQYPLIKASPYDLNADKLDYFLRDSLLVNLISLAEARSVLNNITIKNNIIHCQDIDTATFVFNKFIELNRSMYLNPITEGNTIVFKYIIDQLAKSKVIKLENFHCDEESIITKIKQSPYQSLLNAISKNLEVIPSDEDGFMISRKLRLIDPRIVECNGASLTQISERAKQIKNQYLQTPSIVKYKIPLLSAEIEKRLR